MVKNILLFLLVLIIVNGIKADTNFIIEIDIPSDYNIIPGENLLLTTTIYRLDNQRREDISVRSYIEDLDGNVINEEVNTIAIETRVSFFTEIYLPEYLKPGEYIVNTEVEYKDNTYSAKKRFTVIKKPYEFKIKESHVFIFLLISVILFIIVSIYQNRKINKLVKYIKGVELDDLEEVR